jgi:hypothetical protein
MMGVVMGVLILTDTPVCGCPDPLSADSGCPDPDLPILFLFCGYPDPL